MQLTFKTEEQWPILTAAVCYICFRLYRNRDTNNREDMNALPLYEKAGLQIWVITEVYTTR